MSTPPAKTCARCGREIVWRRKWARNWDRVKYCGERCRRTKTSPRDEALEQAILELLEARPRGASICPSEAARAALPADAPGDAWRALLEPAREAARRLVAAGRIEITQQGRVVDPSRARGPIRLRLRSRAARAGS